MTSRLSLQINLSQIQQNSMTLQRLCSLRGASLLPVTKALHSHPRLLKALAQTGCNEFGESRLEHATDPQPYAMRLLRPPHPQDAETVIQSFTHSHVSSPLALEALSQASQKLNREHEVTLMVEGGDLREGMDLAHLPDLFQKTLDLKNLKLRGVGLNLSCLNGLHPNEEQARELLLRIRSLTPARYRISIANSFQLHWLLNQRIPLQNCEFRLGESLLLGLHPGSHQPVDGLTQGNFKVQIPILESLKKENTPFGGKPGPNAAKEHYKSQQYRPGRSQRLLLKAGFLDLNPQDICLPETFRFEGASSDTMVVSTSTNFHSDFIEIQPGYQSICMLMRSPDTDLSWKTL